MAPGWLSANAAHNTQAWKTSLSDFASRPVRRRETMSLCTAKRSGKGTRIGQQPSRAINIAIWDSARR
jgi:hypothetical protein